MGKVVQAQATKMSKNFTMRSKYTYQGVSHEQG